MLVLAFLLFLHRIFWKYKNNLNQLPLFCIHIVLVSIEAVFNMKSLLFGKYTDSYNEQIKTDLFIQGLFQ